MAAVGERWVVELAPALFPHHPNCTDTSCVQWCAFHLLHLAITDLFVGGFRSNIVDDTTQKLFTHYIERCLREEPEFKNVFEVFGPPPSFFLVLFEKCDHPISETTPPPRRYVPGYGIVIAMCGIQTHEHKQIGELRRLSVSTEHRRQSLATLILDKVKEVARQHNIKQIYLETANATYMRPANLFYLKHQFTQVGDYPLTDNKNWRPPDFSVTYYVTFLTESARVQYDERVRCGADPKDAAMGVGYPALIEDL